MATLKSKSGASYNTKTGKKVSSTGVVSYQTPNTSSTPSRSSGSSSSSPTNSSYTIKSGDTLGKLASQYGTTTSALMSANPNIKNANMIYAGSTLNIPGASNRVSSTTLSSKDRFNIENPTIGVNDLTSKTDTPSLPDIPMPTDVTTDANANNVLIQTTKDNAVKNAEPLTIGDKFQQLYGIEMPRQESTVDLLEDGRKKLKIDSLQQAADSLDAQIGAINAQAQAQILASQGQGRGIPEYILGGQQEQISRKAAIEVLPLQAQLLAAQGNLDRANQTLDRWFKAASQDIENEYNYNMALTNAVVNYADKQQAQKLEDKRQQETFAQQEKMANLDFQRQVYMNQLGFSNQVQLKQMDIDKDVADVTKVQQQATQESLSSMSLVENLLNSGQVENVVGINRLNPFNYIPGSKVQYAKNQFNEIKALLSLENRQKLKGQGAVSDFEGKMLAQASSALGTNLSNADAIRELKKIKGVFANSAGLPATVQITDPTTGKSVVVNATREIINQALIDGANIEYR